MLERPDAAGLLEVARDVLLRELLQRASGPQPDAELEAGG